MAVQILTGQGATLGTCFPVFDAATGAIKVLGAAAIQVPTATVAAGAKLDAAATVHPPSVSGDVKLFTNAALRAGLNLKPPSVSFGATAVFKAQAIISGFKAFTSLGLALAQLLLVAGFKLSLYTGDSNAFPSQATQTMPDALPVNAIALVLSADAGANPATVTAIKQLVGLVGL